METLWQHTLLLLNISSKIQMHPSGRNLGCLIYSGFVFPFFFFYLNLPECDCCTGILISHYLIASIFLKIRSQNCSKVSNFSCNIGTCNTYVRLFSQRFFLQFLTDTSGRKKFVLGNYLNVSTNSSHSQNKQKDSFHQIFPT